MSHQLHIVLAATAIDAMMKPMAVLILFFFVRRSVRSSSGVREWMIQ